MRGHKPRGKLFYGWVIVATLFITNVAVQAAGTLNLGLFVLPMSADLHLSRSLFGWVQTTRFLASGVSSFFVGRALDRFGPRLLIAAGAAVTGLALWGLSNITHAWQFFALFAIIGASGLWAPGGALTSVPVAKWFVRRRGPAMALATLGLGVGGFAFTPIAQLLISHLGWRNAWVVLGAICAGIIVPLSLLLLRRQPEDIGLAPDGDPPAATDASATSHVVREHSWTLKETLRTGTFWQLSLSFVVMSFAQGGASVHRIPYWVEERGFDAGLVSWSFALDAVGASTMVLLSGYLVSRMPSRYIGAGSCLAFALAVGLMIVGSNSGYLFASTIIFGLAVGANMLVQTYILAEYFGRGFLGAIRGLALPMTLFASGAGAPFNGYVYDHIGSYIPSWWLFTCLYVVAGVVMLAARPPRLSGIRQPIASSAARS